VALYDVDGGHVASRCFGTPGADEAFAVAVDQAGAVTVGAPSAERSDIDGVTHTCATADCPDAYLAQLPPALAPANWVQVWTGASAQRLYDIGLGAGRQPPGDGLVRAEIILPLAASIASAGDDDIFLARLARPAPS